MSDLIIRDLDPAVSRSLEQRARSHDRDVSDEAKDLLRIGLGLEEQNVFNSTTRPPGMGLGTWMFNLVPLEYRVDLDCEMPTVSSDPPDFS